MDIRDRYRFDIKKETSGETIYGDKCLELCYTYETPQGSNGTVIKFSSDQLDQLQEEIDKAREL